jgi:hypothetical protein
MTAHEVPAILQSDPAARELLQSPIMARLAYTWSDGTPRVVPMWFHWTGEEILMGAPPNAPKLKVLVDDAPVAISIDTETWPYQVLTIRGTIAVDTVTEPFAEYAEMARRYLGDEGGEQFLAAARQTFSAWTRIRISPTQANLINFTTTFPSAWSAATAAPA